MLYFKTHKLFIILAFCLLGGCSNTLDTGAGESMSTTISYSTPKDTHVKLWVENSYKTTVAILVDEVQQAGNYSTWFEAVDSEGNNLPEGIYTYHFKASEISHSRIMYLFYQ